jgi:hypothetical protein
MILPLQYRREEENIWKGIEATVLSVGCGDKHQKIAATRQKRCQRAGPAAFTGELNPSFPPVTSCGCTMAPPQPHAPSFAPTCPCCTAKCYPHAFIRFCCVVLKPTYYNHLSLNPQQLQISPALGGIRN